MNTSRCRQPTLITLSAVLTACTAGQVTNAGKPVQKTQVNVLACDPQNRITGSRSDGDGIYAFNPYDPDTDAVHPELAVRSGPTLFTTYDPSDPSVVYSKYVDHEYSTNCDITHQGMSQSLPCQRQDLELTSMASDDSECRRFNEACAALGFGPAFCPSDFYHLPSGSGALTVHVTGPVPIADHNYGEGVIVIDPQNAEHIVAAGIESPGGAAHYSLDGGKSWLAATVIGQECKTFDPPPSDTAFVDPNMDIDSDGNVYIVAWTKNDAYPNRDGILVYKSTDGGRTYRPTTALALRSIANEAPLTQDENGHWIRIHDGPHLRIDKRPNVSPNIVYVDFSAWTYTTVDDALSDMACERRAEDAHARGEQLDCPRLALRQATAVGRSSDGGMSFTLRLEDITGNASVGPNGEVYDLSLPYLYVSSDGIAPFQAQYAFDFGRVDSFGGGNWAWQGFVADSWPHSPYRGNLYAAYGDGARILPSGVRDGGDVYVQTRTGDRWRNQAVLVNDDAPQPNCNGKTPQFLSNVNVAPNGRVDVVWYDRRNDPERANCDPDTTPHLASDGVTMIDGQEHHADIFYSYSLDGGATFAPNILITKAKHVRSGGDYIWVSSGASRAALFFSDEAPDGDGQRVLSATIDFVTQP
jgi:hypothetical protein